MYLYGLSVTGTGCVLCTNIAQHSILCCARVMGLTAGSIIRLESFILFVYFVEYIVHVKIQVDRTSITMFSKCIFIRKETAVGDFFFTKL